MDIKEVSVPAVIKILEAIKLNDFQKKMLATFSNVENAAQNLMPVFANTCSPNPLARDKKVLNDSIQIANFDSLTLANFFLSSLKNEEVIKIDFTHSPDPKPNMMKEAPFSVNVVYIYKQNYFGTEEHEFARDIYKADYNIK